MTNSWFPTLFSRPAGVLALALLFGIGTAPLASAEEKPAEGDEAADTEAKRQRAKPRPRKKEVKARRSIGRTSLTSMSTARSTSAPITAFDVITRPVMSAMDPMASAAPMRHR